MWVLITLIVGVISAFIFFLKKTYGYFKERGIPCPDTKPILGNLGQVLLMTRTRGDIVTDIYKEFQDKRYVGFYDFMQPTILIRDPEIIKDIFVKNYNSFNSNGFEVDEKVDPLMGRNPFVLEGNKWKVVRNQLGPNFSSGKMKNMFPLIECVGNKFKKYLELVSQVGEAIDCKDLCIKFTTENVASCAFGLEGHAFTDENSEFVKNAKNLFDSSFTAVIKFMVLMILPKLKSIIKVRFFTTEVTKYLIDVVQQTINYRSDNKIVRNDFLDMMIGLKEKSTEYKFTDLDVAAHAAGFFGDGVETSAIVFSYTLFEIANNIDVQDKLRSEIERVTREHNGKITYEAVQALDYLECIINESLRKYAPISMLTKKCSESFQLPPVNEDGTGAELLVEKGMIVVIPLDGLHLDEKYHKDPEKFNPDRFTTENKTKMTKCTFLPFGEGPRVCLGMRFGMLQIKIGIMSLISDFAITVNKKTITPLVNDPKNFLRTPLGGIWIDVEKILK